MFYAGMPDYIAKFNGLREGTQFFLALSVGTLLGAFGAGAAVFEGTSFAVAANYKGTVIVQSTSAYNAGAGGGLMFRGKYTVGGASTEFAQVAGLKADAVDGNYGGYLVLYARQHGAIGLAEVARLDYQGMRIGAAGTRVDDLHIFGSSSGKGLSVTAPAAGAATVNVFNNAQSSGEFEMGQGWASGTDNVGYLLNRSNAAMVFGTNSAQRMEITSTGLVGIGASAVAQSLHNVNATTWLAIGNGNSAVGMTFYSGTTNEGRINFADGTGAPAAYAGYIQYNHSTDRFVLATGVGSERLWVDANCLTQRSSAMAAGTWTEFIRSDNIGLFKFINGGASGNGDFDFQVNTGTGYITGFMIERTRRNYGFGVDTNGCNGIGVIGIANGTAPTSSLAAAGILWVESGTLKYRGSAGTVTTLAAA